LNSSISTLPLLETKALVCGYKNKPILKGVDFTVLGGERWAVVGDNGEGKSTLLQTLIGLLEPLAGELVLSTKPSEMALVPQHPTRDFRMPMTIGDFVELGFFPENKTARAERKVMVDVALNRLGLHQRDVDISILSGGQFQRAVLARALVQHPCLLFLDEPTRGLDQKSNALFMKELRCCPRHSSPAVFMVLHDLRLLKQHFSHVLWVKEGTALPLKTSELEAHGELVEFLGNAR
jgi:ABC-type Mn2+/Zn2+ transport system ATPase subunit